MQDSKRIVLPESKLDPLGTTELFPSPRSSFSAELWMF